MGYYSNFTITTEPKVPVLELMESINAHAGYSAYDLNDAVVIGEAKWYQCIDDLKVVSKEYPDVLIKCLQVGEDGRHTLHYIKNGKSQSEKAVVTFGESKL